MRNLKNVHRSLLESPPGFQLTAATWDVETNSVICAYGPSKDQALLELKRWSNPNEVTSPGSTTDDTLKHIASWDAPCPNPDIDCDEILDLHFFSDISTVCLVLAGGDIVIVREDPRPEEDRIEIVGSVDAGISAASWSPDEELLAITTRARTFLYMTRDFENVTDITFSSDDLKASKHVSVGWGKAETQFKGKRSRLLRDPTMPETVDEGTIHEPDRKDTTISWRGDGAYVAVNCIEPGSRRVIRVFSREGALDGVSEPVDGLVGALSWRPMGNLIAGIQRAKDCVNVVFFERNGLRHGQFPLRLTEDETLGWASDIALNWNVDSSVLAICFEDRVQLWTMGNYHYYLKQEIFSLTPALSRNALSLTWHAEKPMRFIFGSEGGIQRLEYNPVVAGGPHTPPDDLGILAVIDGRNLKLTPMRLTNIPPPLSLHELALSSNAVDVAVEVIRTSKPRVFIGVLHHESVSLWEWDFTNALATPFLKWCSKTSFESPSSYLQQQVAFCGGNALALLLNNVNGSEVQILDLETGRTRKTLQFANDGFRGLVAQQANVRLETILLLKGTLVISASDLAQPANSLEVVQRLGLSPNSSPRVEVISLPSKSTQNKSDLPNGDLQDLNRVMFGLSDNGVLFANERVLARNCTSFLVTPAHLIFTTGQHLLKFVHMVGVDDIEVPPDTPELDERCRSIERGAKLVTVMPSIFALVMQMPRGNLETIYPRALVLVGIRQNIDEKRYKKAFLSCRSHRVDMNILHDHDPKEFIENIELFVDQIEKVEHIDLFMSQLREEDVSITMYKQTLEAGPPKKKKIESEAVTLPSTDREFSKVNSICNAILKILYEQGPAQFQNIITAHVCKVPPDLDAGLTEISKMRSRNPELIDGAIEHICFLADVNRLYDNALGLYDLELTLLVAQQSQKDPREYLPFLQNLQEMPLLRRRYSIDNHLRRYEKALQHLRELNVFEDTKAYILKHGLYTDAMELYRYQEDQLAQIMRLYADHLQQNSKFKEAGIAYDYLREYASASESYHLAHLWRESLTCATLISLPKIQLQSLAQSLADECAESKDFFSAATIQLDYLQDIPTATRLFCKGYFVADALRTITLHQRPDLLDSVIDPGLVDAMASTTELIADCKAQLAAQVPRIRNLRHKKADDPLAFFDGDPATPDIPDNISLAPTDASTTGGNSLFTRYTNRTVSTASTGATRQTSKNRRREERKRARGKKGSVYEEEYLVRSVGRLIERVNSSGDEVARLVVGLTRRGMRERARAVESAMVDVVELCRGAVGEVFEKREGVTGVEGEEGKGRETERPKGADGVLWDSITGENTMEAPVVKGFETLSLL